MKFDKLPTHWVSPMSVLLGLLTILIWAVGFLLLLFLVADLVLMYMRKKIGPVGGMWGSAGIAGWVLFLFVADLIFGMFGENHPSLSSLSPFGGISWSFDILVILASAVVLFLAWDVHRELK